MEMDTIKIIFEAFATNVDNRTRRNFSTFIQKNI